MNALPATSAYPKLGIIAGGGDLPQRIIDSCLAQGREFFILAIEGNADSHSVEAFPHAWTRIGAIGQALETLRNAGVQELVLAGRMKRPALAALRPDAGGVKLMAKLGSALLSGDNTLLSRIVAFFEEEGFRVIGADDILSDLLAPAGPLGRVLPDARAQEDISVGVRAARALGELDIGQAVIVQQGIVLGLEAIEGTEALIARCAQLRLESSGGVLVKAKKPAQERRVDLPAIGVQTVEQIHAAGFAGIAIEAGGALIIDRTAVVTLADRLGIFVVGFTVS